MTKNSRKSIVASFGLLSAEIESTHPSVSDGAKLATGVVPERVAAGVIGAAHRAIDDIRTERDRLKAIVESGSATIFELDPAMIDPSPYPDRLPDDDTAEFDSFKRTIETDGQKVPIQVRQHPTVQGRYEVVYGHRRWRAAAELGVSVKAILVEMSDLDLVVAQGIENANRQDLTWIERALFASRMDEAGIKPRHIYSALSIEDAELARMRGVYRTLPRDMIAAIGRAPKIGRPRWMDLARAVTANPELLPVLRSMLSELAGSALSSSQRFQKALEATKPTKFEGDAGTPIVDVGGRILGKWKAGPKELRFVAEGVNGVAFLKFVGDELPDLIERFVRLHKDQES